MNAYHATKYDSARDEVIAILSDPTEGFGSEDYFGDVESPVGYVQIVRLDETMDLDFEDHTNYPLGDEAGETARAYGVTAADVYGRHAVVTNSQGFVDVLTFDFEETLQKWLSQTRLTFEEWDDQE